MERKEVTREDVQHFYSNAAEIPNNDLCCPTNYPAEDTSHIPKEVVERFYGCGSPVKLAEIGEGETVIDLGSGAGIDCFISSKKVGARGIVIGIDMTDKMLKVANSSMLTVGKNLGYSNVEFRKGFLEDIPVKSNTADVVMSNCVINLSPNKTKVFREISRTLKDSGRIIISDVVSEVELPSSIRNNKQLWGECLGGCVTENQLIAHLEQAGFYAVELLEKTYWKNIDNINFYSVSIKAYKFSGSGECLFDGQKAIYKGPFKVIIDDEGHVFPRNQEVEICTDTAIKLSRPPYKEFFWIYNSENFENDSCCSVKNKAESGNNSCC